MVVLQYFVLSLVIINAILAGYKILSHDCNTKDEVYKNVEGLVEKMLIVALLLYFIIR